LFGHSMNEAFAAGGLEAGFFAGGVPGMDIIEMQCTMTGLHSPSEKMELVSFNRMYELLVKLIERLP
ncbi:MAG: aminoacyl-histidine dipeptidase, partial [Clostridia bacterium]|nr:aminoacyl-histidine dipeptidase [Clostridia bacterium]